MLLANQIEDSINNLDPSVVNDAFHLPTFINRFVLPNRELPGTLQDFNNDFISGFTRKFDFGSIIIKQLNESNSYSFIKHYRKGDSQHLIFRLFADDGLNYHDYELIEMNNQTKIVDVYIYMTGENFSDTLKRLYLSTLFDHRKNSSIDAVNEEYIYALALIKEIRNFLNKKKLYEAIKLFNGIPLRFKKEKMFQIMSIQIAKNLDDEEYMKSIEDYQTLFPQDPSLFLISLDGYFLKGQYVKALQALDQLDEHVGKDPILNLYRGNIYFTIGDATSAISCFRQVTIDVPEFELGHLGLLNSLVEGYRYNEALEILDVLLQRFRFKLLDLIKLINEFPEFKNSPHFVEWLERWT